MLPATARAVQHVLWLAARAVAGSTCCGWQHVLWLTARSVAGSTWCMGVILRTSEVCAFGFVGVPLVHVRRVRVWVCGCASRYFSLLRAMRLMSSRGLAKYTNRNTFLFLFLVLFFFYKAQGGFLKRKIEGEKAQKSKVLPYFYFTSFPLCFG